ncbi:Zeta_toxin domain-containing protein [Psidium guajava]|nr:Zeta_toxin domain-containing protein [Psidium guajava]
MIKDANRNVEGEVRLEPVPIAKLTRKSTSSCRPLQEAVALPFEEACHSGKITKVKGSFKLPPGKSTAAAAPKPASVLRSRRSRKLLQNQNRNRNRRRRPLLSQRRRSRPSLLRRPQPSQKRLLSRSRRPPRPSPGLHCSYQVEGGYGQAQGRSCQAEASCPEGQSSGQAETQGEAGESFKDLDEDISGEEGGAS